jgi:nucleoid-associated protein YgaU
VRGDTLWALAARRLGDPFRWRELFAANRDVVEDPDLISPGEELQIPDCGATP